LRQNVSSLYYMTLASLLENLALSILTAEHLLEGRALKRFEPEDINSQRHPIILYRTQPYLAHRHTDTVYYICTEYPVGDEQIDRPTSNRPTNQPTNQPTLPTTSRSFGLPYLPIVVTHQHPGLSRATV